MSNTTTFAIDYIVSSPDIVGGKPRIEGSRISVPLIVDLYVRQGIGVEQIASAYEITPAQIHAALAYYYDHQIDVDQMLVEEDQFEADHVDRQRQAEMRALATTRLREYLAQNQEMTATEVAETYGLTPRAVRKAAMSGSIPARKSGSTWLIRRRDAEAHWGGSRSDR